MRSGHIRRRTGQLWTSLIFTSHVESCVYGRVSCRGVILTRRARHSCGARENILDHTLLTGEVGRIRARRRQHPYHQNEIDVHPQEAIYHIKQDAAKGVDLIDLRETQSRRLDRRASEKHLLTGQPSLHKCGFSLQRGRSP